MQLRQMLDIKEKISEMLLEPGYTPSNSLIEGILYGIGLDAQKHIKLFEGLLNRAQGVNRAIEEDSKKVIIERIDTVLQLEWNIINQIKILIDQVTDQTTKKILNTILGDIQRHEKTLSELKKVIKSLSKEEETVLDQIWKYSLEFTE